MVIDSHCHVHDPAYADLKETLRLSMAHDVWGTIAVGCDAETNAQTLEAAAAAPKAVWACLGFHPDRSDLSDDDLQRVEAQIAAHDALEALRHHGVERAVFHWHKAPAAVTRAIVDAGYMVSVTPDVVLRDRDRDLVTGVPLDALLVESDGPWEYGGEFEGVDSGPWLASRVAEEVAKLKRLPVEDVMYQLSTNACRLFDLMWA